MFDIDQSIAVEEKGYTVRQVSNVIHKTTKDKLPMFFIDLEPAEINKDIFNLTSLLYTRVKIEEPHKRKTIVQCLNCRPYGHSRKYRAYPLRCVYCWEYHQPAVWKLETHLPHELSAKTTIRPTIKTARYTNKSINFNYHQKDKVQIVKSSSNPRP